MAAAEPPRTLLLLRHAKAVRDGADDFERPLAPRGRAAAGDLATHLAATARPDIVLCSAARRTRETLDPILGRFDHDLQVRIERALYLAEVETLLTAIHALPPEARTALLIGHNPGMHELAVMLVGAGDAHLRRQLDEKFPTGALAAIEIAGPWGRTTARAGRLIDFVTPHDFE